MKFTLDKRSLHNRFWYGCTNKKIIALEDFILLVTFDDNRVVEYDMKDDIKTLPGYDDLQNIPGL